ncbi:hypothetical protein ZHAS_00014098 [Anopheles sinensis]|uniref:Uncharacterized protein n=1 Tax=Anopheles sinensis TaxID=74873 RepID=A0A084W7C5_ANOSI|nr:hypothetical protein ZHAS_00014098 [Anopheles sinensis]
MSESVEMELLINCTQATIQRFPWSTDYNTTVISELNRTEILDVLGEMITKSRSYVPKSDDLLTLSALGQSLWKAVPESLQDTFLANKHQLRPHETAQIESSSSAFRTSLASVVIARVYPIRY